MSKITNSLASSGSLDPQTSGGVASSFRCEKGTRRQGVRYNQMSRPWAHDGARDREARTAEERERGHAFVNKRRARPMYELTWVKIDTQASVRVRTQRGRRRECPARNWDSSRDSPARCAACYFRSWRSCLRSRWLLRLTHFLASLSAKGSLFSNELAGKKVQFTSHIWLY